ncbi:GNAT family N-acetyltransferase [Streptomyces sp. NBC_01500]|uniref:GNAT family N-acetyltransferase n=1 Tax=Streptomyces sp. NBC_01500 TaxID=2903886 RepID=UPI00224E7AE5|nr:GNAT family N-acetyltransferase [Streptomyces sp. NBC_01500]MCX4549403.1 GNAT family N-acetyltransferase [Streptomyces sp. NBC_01500]
MHAGYAIRAPKESELPAVVHAVNEAARSHDPTAAARTDDEFRHVWAQLDTADDVRVVTGPGGAVCGYAELSAAAAGGRIFADAYTHPAHLGAGIGTALLRWMEARAAEMAPGVPAAGDAAPVALVNHVLLDGAADRMLRARGYSRTRIHLRMRMALGGPAVAPVWPDGVGLRACDGTPEDLRRVHACVEEAFGDHWGRVSRSYDQWAGDLLHDGFDPALWLVAERRGRIVGAALCREREVEGHVAGEVGQLGVRREARRLGLGRALLLASFALFAERGAGSVGLDVDSESLTGAHLLYERAGMVTTAGIGRFELELPVADGARR